jgi:hypothetical protein
MKNKTTTTQMACCAFTNEKTLAFALVIFSHHGNNRIATYMVFCFCTIAPVRINFEVHNSGVPFI